MVSFSIQLDVEMNEPHSRTSNQRPGPKFHFNPSVFTLALDPNLMMPHPFLSISDEILIQCRTPGLAQYMKFSLPTSNTSRSGYFLQSFTVLLSPERVWSILPPKAPRQRIFLQLLSIALVKAFQKSFLLWSWICCSSTPLPPKYQRTLSLMLSKSPTMALILGSDLKGVSQSLLAPPSAITILLHALNPLSSHCMLSTLFTITTASISAQPVSRLFRFSTFLPPFVSISCNLALEKLQMGLKMANMDYYSPDLMASSIINNRRWTWNRSSCTRRPATSFRRQ